MNELLFGIDAMLFELVFPITVYYDEEFEDWVYQIQMSPTMNIIVHGIVGYTKMAAYEGALRWALALPSLNDRIIQ